MKHNKLIITYLAATSALGATLPLVTACSKTSQVINHVHQSSEDVKYGIGVNTYKQLKKDYESKFNKMLDSEGIQAGSDLRKSKLNQFNAAINAFDGRAKSTSITYGQLTSALINYASVTDGIQLRRVTNTKWSDINALFQGAYDSFDLYMTHEHFSESQKKQILSDAVIQFNAKIVELEAKGYKENDPYGALVETRNQLITFFDGVNDQIAKVSAQQRLSDFITKYSFKYKTDDSNARLSSLRTSIPKFVGKDMSGIFNNIFYVIDNETGNKVSFEPTLLIPGYTITPTLEAYSFNDEANQYGIDISWSIIKTSIKLSKDTKRIKYATAYLHRDFDFVNVSQQKKQIESKNIQNMDQMMDYIDSKQKVLCSTDILDIPTNEKQRIQEIYFNKQSNEYIRLRLAPTKEEGKKLDPYVAAMNHNTYEGTLGTYDLAQAGLQISQDGINWVNMFQAMNSGALKKHYQLLEPDNPKHTLSLCEKFANYCLVSSNFKILFSQNNGTSVQNKFTVRFANTCDNNSNDNLYEISEQVDADNVQLTEQFFLDTCRYYSNAKKTIEIYDTDNGISPIQSIVNRCIGWSVALSAIAASALAIAAAIVIKGITKAGALDIYDILGLISCASAVGFATAGNVILNKSFLQPTNQFLNKMKNLNSQDYTQNILNHIKSDKDILVYIDDNGQYNTIDFNSKKMLFMAKGESECVRISSYYTNLYDEGEDGYFFMLDAENNGVSMEQYNELVNNFKYSNPDFKTIVGHTTSAGFALISAIAALCKKKEEKKEEDLPKPETDDGTDAVPIDELGEDLENKGPLDADTDANFQDLLNEQIEKVNSISDDNCKLIAHKYEPGSTAFDLCNKKYQEAANNLNSIDKFFNDEIRFYQNGQFYQAYGSGNKLQQFNDMVENYNHFLNNYGQLDLTGLKKLPTISVDNSQGLGLLQFDID